MTPEIEDPILIAAIARAEKAQGVAAKMFRGDDEVAEELGRISTASIEHLRAGRLDEAIAQAQLTVELDEQHGDGEAWREFAILAEEAAETGR